MVKMTFKLVLKDKKNINMNKKEAEHYSMRGNPMISADLQK